jgi:transketolase
VLALTRQNLPALRTGTWAANRSAEGGYVLAEAEDGARQVTLIATGSEVEIAMKARALLAAEGVGAAVVSMPCCELFDELPDAAREKVLGAGTVRIVIEAGVGFGWDRYLGNRGTTVTMPSFGASAPFQELYEHFGITAEAAAKKAKDLLAAK